MPDTATTRRQHWLLLLACCVLLSVGCADEAPPAMPLVPSSLVDAKTEVEVPEVDSGELQTLITSNARPLLVEFSVLSGCYRCDQMRSPIRRKAAEISKHADIVRIDYNLNKTLAESVGATVCPSYVLYSKGEIVSVRTWPTSADFVAEDAAALIR